MAKGKPFAPEFRRRWLYRVSGKPFKDVADDLGIAPESLRRWVLQQEIARPRARFDERRRMPPAVGLRDGDRSVDYLTRV